MILVVVGIELVLTPCEDGLQLVNAALYGLYLVVGIAIKANAGGRIGIFGVPDQVGHYALILTTGNQRITADFGILFDYQYGITILRSLRGSSDTRATGTNDDHIIGAFDGFLGFIGKGLRTGLQGSDAAASFTALNTARLVKVAPDTLSTPVEVYSMICGNRISYATSPTCSVSAEDTTSMPVMASSVNVTLSTTSPL